ncbi:MAG: undecaprenyl/decaprenyl-phosphate alpha-N-acetylglucosaminyl 1-phosphate transferase [Candidatus Omnitrophica bacterium]|nr:undecaprenyl/decaprenyl-phosphate alpha-N-acetylglucosaminyl 1-phosphate transferase [Candidatus Omnitrophota bacterium]
MFKIFIFAFAGSVIFTWIAIRVARKFDIMDRPTERKVHSEPVPLLGGLAIYAACMLAILLNFHFSLALKGVVIASSIMLVSGLVDDINDLPAWMRLIIQLVCAVIVIMFGVRLNIIPDHLPFAVLLEGVITVIWIVGITNALNFLDGIDGLAAGLMVIASGTFFIIAYQTAQPYFAFLSAALAGSSLGFLLFNFNPAKIFLGDAGSSFLGFMIASLAVMGEWAENKPIVALSIPLLILALLIFDMIYISVSRIAQGRVRTFREWIEYVGKDHLHHRLMWLGFTQRQTVFFIYLVSLVFSLGALALHKATTVQALLLLLQGIMILVIVTVLMLVSKDHIDKSRAYDHRSEGMIDLKETS